VFMQTRVQVHVQELVQVKDVDASIGAGSSASTGAFIGAGACKYAEVFGTRTV